MNRTRTRVCSWFLCALCNNTTDDNNNDYCHHDRRQLLLLRVNIMINRSRPVDSRASFEWERRKTHFKRLINENLYNAAPQYCECEENFVFVLCSSEHLTDYLRMF